MRYIDALEAVYLTKAGILRPWSWDEWRELPDSFVRRFLEASQMIATAGREDSGDDGGDSVESDLAEASSAMGEIEWQT